VEYEQGALGRADPDGRDRVQDLLLGPWRLGQLYRVASFIGLAEVLIMVSFLYQRFMTGKDEEEKQKA
jgi:hypothetical protein